MQGRTQPGLRPDAEWIALVGDIVNGNDQAREHARSIMWLEVGCYVERVATLPIGPLNDDEEARRDIAVSVLKKLEARSYFHLREWRDRQRRQRDHASWWGWIKTVSWCVAIDHARTSRLNIARRGAPFEWVRMELVDPFVLGETLGSTLDFLARCGEQELHEFIAHVQSALGDDDAAAAEGAAAAEAAEAAEADDAPSARGSQTTLPRP